MRTTAPFDFKKFIATFVFLAISAIMFGFAAKVSAQPVVKTKTPNEGLIVKMSRNFTECPLIASTRSTAEAKVAIMAANPREPGEWNKVTARADIIASACLAEAETRNELAPRPATAGDGKPEMTIPVIERVPAAKLKLIS